MLDFLRPSAASVWTQCAAYLRASAGYVAPPESADEVKVREEGTACHWVAQQLFATGEVVPVGTLAPNNIAVDKDMQDTAVEYTTVIWNTVQRPAQLHVEEKVDCSIIYPNMSGSPDCWAYDGALWVFDLKYGYGFVDEFWNLQLTIYALALANLLALADDTVANLTIFQPRAITSEGPWRTWATTVGELRTKFLGMLQMRAYMAMAPEAPATSGLHCLDCAGRFQCSTFINTAREVCRYTSKSVPLDLSPAVLGAELRIVKDMKKIIEGREESLKSQIESAIRAGKNVPGWKFAPSKGREAYKHGMEQAFLGAAKLFGVDASRPITPGEARKLLPSHVVDAFVERPKAGMALSYVSEKEISKKLGSKK